MQKARTPEANAMAIAFGQRMKAARAEAGLTQAQLQERLAEHGVRFDTSAITRVEAGEREPRISEARAIASVLGIGLSTLTAAESDLGSSMDEIRRLISESRDKLLDLVRAVDKVADAIQHRGD